jgi:hypothetical protein
MLSRSALSSSTAVPDSLMTRQYRTATLDLSTHQLQNVLDLSTHQLQVHGVLAQHQLGSTLHHSYLQGRAQPEPTKAL